MKLVIDTSYKYLSVALVKDDQIVDYYHQKAWQKQSELLAKVVDQLFKDNKVNPQEIKEVYVSRGPGSYTGVRIAVAFAKVFSYSNNAKLYSLSSLLLIAGCNGKKIGLIDARNDRFYFGMYQDGRLIEKEKVVTSTELNNIKKDYPDWQIITSQEGIIDNVLPVIKMAEESDFFDLAPWYLT